MVISHVVTLSHNVTCLLQMNFHIFLIYFKIHCVLGPVLNAWIFSLFSIVCSRYFKHKITKKALHALEFAGIYKCGFSFSSPHRLSKCQKQSLRMWKALCLLSPCLLALWFKRLYAAHWGILRIKGRCYIPRHFLLFYTCRVCCL